MNFKIVLLTNLLLFSNSIYADSKSKETSVFLEYERSLMQLQKSNHNTSNTFTKNETIKNKSAKIVVPEKQKIVEEDLSYLVVNPVSASCPQLQAKDKTDELESKSKKTLSEKVRLLKEKVIAKAKLFLGTPYKFGSKSQEQTDCSGFIQQVYSDLGVSLPRTTASQAELGESIDFDDLEIGDLMFFHTYKKGPSHVAIYAGNNQMIHASWGAKRVKYDNINKRYYKKRFMFGKRMAFKKLVKIALK